MYEHLLARFPSEFVWGVATSAHQIEGAIAEDGRTPSVWDTFAGMPGAITDGADGSVACDHYHRSAEDIGLLADLGVDSYRFSLSWSRVQPAPGETNKQGLAFYDRLVDELLESGISPLANLFHWDLPQWAQDAGGWQNRETVNHFGEYAATVVAALGDRVGTWGVMNEMFEHCLLGHVAGEHAPGLTLPLDQALGVAHHLLVAHGIGVQAIRVGSSKPVMLINSYSPARPASDSELDLGATYLYDLIQNRLFTDPILLGSYPEALEPMVAPFVQEGDMDTIASPVDLLGVNYYTVNTVRALDGPVPLEVIPAAGYPVTGFGWGVCPDGLSETLLMLKDGYGADLPPIHISENGCSYEDEAGDSYDDQARIDFLAAHISAVGDAIEAGVDVRGYYVWSLLDNFEWAEGYTQRFGLVHVDFESQERSPRASYNWYRDLMGSTP